MSDRRDESGRFAAFYANTIQGIMIDFMSYSQSGSVENILHFSMKRTYNTDALFSKR